MKIALKRLCLACDIELALIIMEVFGTAVFDLFCS